MKHDKRDDDDASILKLLDELHLMNVKPILLESKFTFSGGYIPLFR